jgi:tetratricopeptide (TPR) repeat protein
MSDKRYTYEELEDYVNGVLDPDRKAAIDEMAENDAELREELNTLQLTADISREAERQRLKQTLTAPRKVRPVGFAFGGLIAATLALLIIFNRGGDPSLYSEYYEPLTENVIMRDTEVHPGIQAYSNGDYGTALELLEEPAAPDSLQIYYAICLMEAERFDESMTVLSTISENDSDYYAARWYEALSLLALDRTEDCQKALKSIGTNSPYHSQAADLLRKIK